MSAPLIGLTSYGEPAQWGVWNQRATVLPSTYSDAVRDAGGAPALLPPGGDAAEAASVMARVDGLLLAGGADVAADRYGALPHPATDLPRTDRDDYELALLQEALRLAKPVLAICRGLQLLNVALGGTLHQHLPDALGHDGHCAGAGVMTRHQIRVEPGTQVAELVGDTASVATYHHQGIDQLGQGLRAVAWSDDDLIEAVELQGAPWVFAVQWHPEVDRVGRLFEKFVQACATVPAS